MRVALPFARVAVRRVQGPCTVRTAASAPLAGIALPVWLGAAQGHTRYIQASAQAAGGEQAILATLSHSGPRVTVWPSFVYPPGVGGGGWKGFLGSPPGPEIQSSHLPAQGRLCGPCYTRSPSRAAARPGR
jgi:hypothetical protein